MKKRKKAAKARSVNLNLIIWISFLLFAVVLIAVFTVVQNYQLNRQYREKAEANLLEAGETLKVELAQSSGLDVSKIMLSVANRYGVSAYLFSADGTLVFPDGEDAEDYEPILELVREGFAQIMEEGKPVERAQAIVTSDSMAGYATMVNVWGKSYYLYLSHTYEMINRITAEMTLYSLISALIAVALSFVISGFVSMIITKPVTEVTERANALARGDFSAPPHGHYFCTEVNELSEALDYAGTEISKTDRMQKELIANVSHDFKTPLTMIKAYAAMIDEISGDDPEKRKKHTRIIIEEADRLAALVADVLDLSRLQSDADTIERTVFNLTEEVYKVAGKFGYLTETEGYVIATEIDEDVYTFAGKERVEQVLYNLLGNAFQYTGEDKKVTVRLKRREKDAHFEVEDTGKGIPPEELETIWERYYRSKEAHKRPVCGTGLGLAIVKNVLLKYNIPFGVWSEVGKGSTFWVDFPLPPEDSPPAP